MRNVLKISLFASTALFIGHAAQAEDAATETAHFKLEVNQPSLFDATQFDHFKGSVDDRSGTTNIEVTCSAGTNHLFGMSRINEACKIGGSGLIKSPNDPTKTLPRVNYSGGFTVEAKKDGYTDASTIVVNYMRAGAAPAETTSFGGDLIMMPENPSKGALALGAAVIDNLKKKAGGGDTVTYDTKIDSVRFESFKVPGVGGKDNVSCSWTGDWIFSYASSGWQGAFDITCGDKTYHLDGNMPLVDAPAGSKYQQEYDVNLVAPGAAGADPFAAADPFNPVPGIQGKLEMTNSGQKTDGGVYQNVKVEGDLTGTGVPLEVVRGWGEIMNVLARKHFGA